MELVDCACGCGEKLEPVDKYGRDRRFISGHNNRKYQENGRVEANKKYQKRNRAKVNEWKAASLRRRKVEAIKWRGGFCSNCWLVYDGTNGAVFHFHHKDPSTKVKGIAKMLVNNSWEAITEELAKCDLLCANCHLTLHNGDY